MDLDQKNDTFFGINITSMNDSIVLDDNITITGTGNYDWSNVTLSSDSVYTITGAGGLLSGANGMSTAELSQAGQLSLHGDNADIKINGESLMATLRGIQDHLNVLRPDPQLEAEWTELAEIRQQYEAKLAEYREKSKVWRALKS